MLTVCVVLGHRFLQIYTYLNLTEIPSLLAQELSGIVIPDRTLRSANGQLDSLRQSNLRATALLLICYDQVFFTNNSWDTVELAIFVHYHY